MKNINFICLLFTMIIMLCCSCSSNTTQSPEQQPSLDFTQLSHEEAYNKVCDMLASPDSYKGQTIKLTGELSVYQDDTTDKMYFSCVVTGNNTDQSQGIEFELTKDLSYPDEYPKPGTEITVEGTFSPYVEAGEIYGKLINATMIAK